jgi:hypothetical protein
MTIFDVLNDLLTKKEGTLIDHPEHESLFVPFLVQRWLSMHSESNTQIVNETSNKLHQCFADDKMRYYKLWLTLLPTSRPKRINYIKKKKEKGDSKEDTLNARIKILASNAELSEREIRLYVEEFDLADTIKKLNI